MLILMPMLMFAGSDDKYDDNSNDGNDVGGDEGK